MDEERDRCGLCLGTEAPVEPASPHLLAIVRDLFSFWPDDVTVVACSECFARIEDFYAYYERVRENQLILRVAAEASESPESSKIIKEKPLSVLVKSEPPVKLEWDDDVVVKKEDDDDDDEIGELREDFASSEENALVTHKKETRSRRACKPHRRRRKRENGGEFDYPTELIRGGKFIVKTRVLEEMASKFYDVRCGECRSEFEKLTQMLDHFTSSHEGRPFVECCNRKIYRKDFMFQHMAKHLQPSAFQCHICNKEFARIQILKQHLGLHLPEGERIHRCDKCDRSFGYKSLLTRHMVSHVPDDEKKLYKCDQCAKVFNNYVSHFNHVRSMHSSPKFLCPECGKSFRLKCNLVGHLEIHNVKKKQCPVCEVMCKTNDSLRQHMKRHSGTRVSCEQCEFTSHDAAILKHHVLMKHTDERPHTCDMCGKRFKLKSGLQTHMAQHTGERKYCCPYCPKAFAQSGNFFKHRKRMHGEEHINAMLAKKGVD